MKLTRIILLLFIILSFHSLRAETVVESEIDTAQTTFLSDYCGSSYFVLCENISVNASQQIIKSVHKNKISQGTNIQIKQFKERHPFVSQTYFIYLKPNLGKLQKLNI